MSATKPSLDDELRIKYDFKSQRIMTTNPKYHNNTTKLCLFCQSVRLPDPCRCSLYLILKYLNMFHLFCQCQPGFRYTKVDDKTLAFDFSRKYTDYPTIFFNALFSKIFILFRLTLKCLVDIFLKNSTKEKTLRKQRKIH